MIVQLDSWSFDRGQIMLVRMLPDEVVSIYFVGSGGEKTEPDLVFRGNQAERFRAWWDALDNMCVI